MSWSQLLEPHGWTIAFERHDIVYWRRPNKTVGVSATTNYGGSDLLYVFSRSTLFEADKSYSKFAAYTILEHDGDFGRAALALFKAGCGDDVQDDDSLSTQTEASAAAASSSAAAARTVRLVPADTIAIRPVRWLWDDRLPLGAFALLGGREGVGKSILTYTLAADLHEGPAARVYAGTPKAVIVAATEDSWQHTIVPRLMAAHADLRHVYRADIIDPTGIELPLSLPKDTTALTHAIAEVDARLVILDPLLSRVDARLDTYKDADTRRALEPLAAMADAAHVCILGLIHVNKSQTTDALTLLMASRAFTAVARAVLFVAADPDQDEQRLLALVKNNLGRSDLPMLQFRIGGALVATTGDGDVWTGQLHWTGESDQSMRDVLDRTADRDSDRTATHDAADWLTDYLTEAGGTAARKAILAAGHRVGHTRPTLDRARHLARLSSEPRGYPRVTYWVLPGTGQSTQLTRSTHVHEGTDPEGTHNARAPVDSVDSVDSSRRSPESTENATGHVVARQSTQAACPSGPESIESTESSGGSASEQAWRDGDRRFAKGWT